MKIRPVAIDDLEFDALISEDRTLDASVPEYSVEDGFVVSDAIILGTGKLNMTLYVTNTPVTWYNRHGASQTRVREVVAKLEEKYYAAKPVTVFTSERTYRNMAIESLSISKSLEAGYSREIPISFKQIRVTSAQKTTIPASYGKSGATGASAGTASTSSGSSGSSSNSDSSGSKGSILYNAGKSLGMI